MAESRAAAFDPVDDATAQRWSRFGRAGTANFATLLGFQVEEVRHGYCRMRLPFKPELKHFGGLVHGGAIASLLDAVLVPAIGVTLPPKAIYSTVDLHVQFIDALVEGDAVAEGWIERQGRRAVFGQSEVVAADTDRLIAKAVSTFNVKA